MALTVAKPEVLNFTAEAKWGSVDYTIREATDPIDEVPALIVPGFFGIHGAYTGFRDALADQGKHAIDPKYPRNMKWPHEFHPGHFLNPHRHASRGLRAVIEDLVEKRGVEEVDLFVHSKGGRDVMWTAKNLSDYIRSVIFIGSVGVGDNQLPHFIPRLPNFVRDEGPEIITWAWRNKSLKLAREGLGHLARPHLIVGETMTIHDASLHGRISGLKYFDIKTGILELSSDTLVPPENSNPAILSEADLAVVMPDALHVAPVTEAERTARHALELLHAILDTPPVEDFVAI